MGCNYDYLSCEYALPEYPYFNPKDMQTKDLAQDMLRYSLRKDGQLIVHGDTCDHCGSLSSDELNSLHTGWVDAYCNQILGSDFTRRNSYDKKTVNYQLCYEFSFEFIRGMVADVKDCSYCSVRQWSEKDRYFIEIKRLPMDEFMNMSKLNG